MPSDTSWKAYLVTRSDKVIIDFSNAFNCLRRDIMLERVAGSRVIQILPLGIQQPFRVAILTVSCLIPGRVPTGRSIGGVSFLLGNSSHFIIGVLPIVHLIYG